MIRLMSLISLVLISTSALADGAAAPAGAPPAPSMVGMFLPLIVVFMIFYFLTIRPQQKKFKQHQEMLKAIQNGDDVILNSGIMGKVAGLTDKFVTLEVATNVKIKVLRSQISQILKGDAQEITS